MTFTSHRLVNDFGFWGILYLAQLDLATVGGEEEHDGEAC